MDQDDDLKTPSQSGGQWAPSPTFRSPHNEHEVVYPRKGVGTRATRRFRAHRLVGMSYRAYLPQGQDPSGNDIRPLRVPAPVRQPIPRDPIPPLMVLLFARPATEAICPPTMPEIRHSWSLPCLWQGERSIHQP